jgi:hypothetical protein
MSKNLPNILVELTAAANLAQELPRGCICNGCLTAKIVIDSTLH